MNTKEKTNVEHLHDLLTKGQDERLEFLEAIKAEMKAKDETIASLQKIVDTHELESNDEDDDEQYSDEIDAGIGTIEYRIETGNIQLQSLMEVFEEKIKKYGSLKIENILSAL